MLLSPKKWGILRPVQNRGYVLCVPGSPMPPCHHDQYFNAQIDELKELDYGVHHYKPLVFGYSSCHNFLFWD